MLKRKIDYEFDNKPDDGATLEIAPGVHWLRMPLPFELNHINLWLFADEDEWVVVDSGLGDQASKDIWNDVLQTVMGGKAIRHVIVTHMHPDHVGCAGWLADRFGVDLWMTREEYTMCRILVADTGRPAPDAGISFYRAAGYDEASLDRYKKMFGMFGRYVTPLPESYRRLYDGQKGPVGNYEWEVIVGNGHSPEHACFFNADLNLLISGDQILPTISSNVSVYPTEPEANPLLDWITSLRAIRERIPADVLVLPSHGKPFRGAHERIDEMLAAHLRRLDELHEFCATPRRAVDVFPALYNREINAGNLMFATGEAIAHLHYLLGEGLITTTTDNNNVTWYTRS